MAIHFLLLAKLPFMHFFRLAPLLWPLNLYFPLARQLHRVCDLVMSTRWALFLIFRLREIISGQPPEVLRGRTRWERAIELARRQLLHRSTSAAEEANLQSLLITTSM